ncbi:MAG: ATP-binding protein [Paracoccaceae bacterium]
MADVVPEEREFAAAGTAWRLPRGTQNLRASRRIAIYLTVSVVFFAITTTAFAFWITREHNRLAATASEQMVRSGMGGLAETVNTVSMDFSIWPDAVRALAIDDRDWVWDNIGISAAITETMDIMMIVPADGNLPYAWAPGMNREPSTTLLPFETVQSMMDRLKPIPVAERRPINSLMRAEDEIWLLTAARIVSENPDEDPELDSDIPRLIFGFKLYEGRMIELGKQFLIDDLSISFERPTDGRTAIPLVGSEEELVGYAVWSPPRPGDQIMRSIAVPMALALGILTLVALVSSNLLSRSARRLESAMLAAQEASRAKSDFVANISHELRTPMNGVIGLGGLLRQTGLDEKQKRMVDMLLSSADNQMRLIGDLLDVNSIEHGRFSLNVAPFSPTSVVESTCALFEIDAQNKKLELNLQTSDPDKAAVLGDKERFRQICANLISNAIKFTDKGRVSVDLKVRSRLGEAMISLTVSDTGRGIAKQDLKNIFDRFAQGTSRERGKASGNGLGLAITKTIIDLMGGAISVESTPGKGSLFRVEMGLDEASEEVLASNAVTQH